MEENRGTIIIINIIVVFYMFISVGLCVLSIFLVFMPLSFVIINACCHQYCLLTIISALLAAESTYGLCLCIKVIQDLMEVFDAENGISPSLTRNLYVSLDHSYQVSILQVCHHTL